MGKAELEMVCDELVGLVTEYLEGTISDVDRERFETHIRECEWCDHYVEQTRAVVAALGDLGEEPPDPDALNRALIAFREARGGSA
jgi:anti-sigma factor RsiW